jgi:hypothetical protein
MEILCQIIAFFFLLGAVNSLYLSAISQDKMNSPCSINEHRKAHGKRRKRADFVFMMPFNNLTAVVWLHCICFVSQKNMLEERHNKLSLIENNF